MKACRRVAIVVVFLLLGGSAILEGQELKKIKIGYPAISYNQIHVWVAMDLPSKARLVTAP